MYVDPEEKLVKYKVINFSVSHLTNFINGNLENAPRELMFNWQDTRDHFDPQIWMNVRRFEELTPEAQGYLRWLLKNQSKMAATCRDGTDWRQYDRVDEVEETTEDDWFGDEEEDYDDF